ncbi:hypothetical protein V5O48_003361 [Marasmius crinis-equi]|uniref:PAS domain-containing protein n=1 Tax=Marasmius crinis-equi TaxID=585013 RepID=A0ABR3FU31_9AGAR
MARAPATGSNLCGDTPFLIPSAAPKDLNLCNSQGFKNPAKPITPSQLTSIGINSSASPTNADSSSSLGLPVYSASGFDLFSVMARVATRPEPKLVLGPVDFMGSFVVSDARRYDCPVIYVSPTFCRLTGYDESEVIGRNCRFLQSPNGEQARGQVRQYTSHEAVKHLKKNLVADKECQTSIINYKKNGDAFINLVTVIPIRGDELGASGDEDKVVYHVGYQVDLTEHPNAILQKLEDGSYIVNYTSNNPVAVKPMNPLNRLFQQQQHHRGLRGIGAGSVALGLGRGGGMAAGVGGLVGVGGYGLGMSAEDRKFNAIGAPVVSPEMKKYLEEPEFLKSFPVTTGVNADAMLAGSTNHLLSLILLEYAPDFLHVVSLIGDFLYVAPSVRRVLGYESYELVGRSLVDICHPSDKVPLMRELIESSSVNLSAGASHAGGSTGEEGEDIVPNPASDPASDILLMRPRTVDLIFRALTKGKRYVWVECRGRLYQEPGKGRKAILLSGRAKEMTGLKWETVKSASGGVRGTEVGVRSVTESPKAVGKDTNWRKRKKAGVEESPAQSPPDKTPEQVDVKSEFWGTITRSGIMLVVTSGVRDVLGYEETDLMGRHVDMITDDKIFLEEVAKVGGTGGMSGVRRTTCRMFRKGYEVGPEEATVEVEVILYPAFVDDTVHNSEQTISPTNVIYQIRRRAGGTEPDVMHLMDEDVFLPLDTNRGSSWQYELQQLRFANDRLKEQIKELEGEMDRKASISSASDSLGGGGLVVANAQRYRTTSNHMLPGVAVYDRRPQPSYEPRASSPWAYHFESVPGLVPVSIPARYQKPERDSTVADEVL